MTKKFVDLLKKLKKHRLSHIIPFELWLTSYPVSFDKNNRYRRKMKKLLKKLEKTEQFWGKGLLPFTCTPVLGVKEYSLGGKISIKFLVPYRQST